MTEITEEKSRVASSWVSINTEHEEDIYERELEEARIIEAAAFIEKRRRRRVLSIGLPGLIGIIIMLWATTFDPKHFPFGISKEPLLILAIILFANAGLAAIITYLQTGFSKTQNEELKEFLASEKNKHEKDRINASESELSTLKLKLRELGADINQLQKQRTQDIDLTQAVEEARDRIISEANSSLLLELKQQAEKAAEKSRTEDMIYIQFGETEERIDTELKSLKKRADVNLAAGAITAALGLGIFLVLINSTPSATDFWSFASSFGPKITLVILIEAFSYFFLKLYKANLLEIKYFQNELTNIQMKFVALISSIDLKDCATQAEITRSLALTERNHILQKDQTTIEIEKARLEKESSESIIKSISEVFKNSKQ